MTSVWRQSWPSRLHLPVNWLAKLHPRNPRLQAAVTPRNGVCRVDRVEPGEIQLAYSFQAAIYESLLEELNKTHQFKQVFREGDRKAGERSQLAVLKATVVKYTPGSETRRAVTTFSGATKLTCGSNWLPAREKLCSTTR